MRKLFCLASQILMYSLVFSQTSQDEDSIRLANLKNALIRATGTNKVDILNDIAQEYVYLKWSSINGFKDSANKYSKWANTEASKINYKHGYARSLLRSGDSSEKNNNLQKAIQIGIETNDHEVLGWAYYSSGGNQPENFKRSVDEFRKGGLEQDEAEVSTWLTTILIYLGKYEEAFPYAERNLSITKKKRTHTIGLQDVLVEASYNNIADLYKVAGDYQSALGYLHEARQYSLIHKDDWLMNRVIAELHIKLGNADSALFYLQKEPDQPPVISARGAAYFLKNEPDRALAFYNRAIDSVTMPRPKPFYTNNKGFMSDVFLKKARAFTAKKDYPAALELIKKSDEYRNTTMTGTIDYNLNRLKLYSDIYHGLGKNDSAFRYLNQYILFKDSVDNKRMIWRLNMKLSSMKTTAANAKKETDLALNKQKLQQQVFIRNSLTGGLILLFIIGFFIFRNLHLKRKNEMLQLAKNLEVQKLENEKKQAELHHRAAELEMQALRAQMNPHFIFNCLSSINRIIMRNDSQSASDYLTRFSRLMRMVLINSQRSMIPLEDELQMVRLYLDMERLRFKDSFDYRIIFTNTIDEGAVFVPPLLLQPFCENAIWHGLMQKDGQGQLTIELSMVNKVLHCTISDDGIGRVAAERLRSKSAGTQKSMGLQITAQRLALLNQNKNIETFYSIEDIKDADKNITGTKVILKIDYKELEEEIV
jgi:tetratricopeptide (TPR) repeat protein/anti-sigma regulatory factor (Ser/Thr protein kinase)